MRLFIVNEGGVDIGVMGILGIIGFGDYCCIMGVSVMGYGVFGELKIMVAAW